MPIPTPESRIPKGPYCYDANGNCPFWNRSQKHDAQENGYCAYLGKGDWEDDDTVSLLWDRCKECGINDDDDATTGKEYFRYPLK